MLNEAFKVAGDLPFRCVAEVVTMKSVVHRLPTGPHGRRIIRERPSSLSEGAQVGVIIIEVSQLAKMTISNIIDLPIDFPSLRPCEPSVAWNLVEQRLQEDGVFGETLIFPSEPVEEHLLLIGPDSKGNLWIDGCFAERPGLLRDSYKLVFQIA